MSYRILRWSVLSLLTMLNSGCLMIQNRYSVFGMEQWQSDSADQVRFWSMALLAGIALGAAIVGGLLMWLGQRWARSRSEQLAPVVIDHGVEPVTPLLASKSLEANLEQ